MNLNTAGAICFFGKLSNVLLFLTSLVNVKFNQVNIRVSGAIRKTWLISKCLSDGIDENEFNLKLQYQL